MSREIKCAYCGKLVVKIEKGCIRKGTVVCCGDCIKAMLTFNKDGMPEIPGMGDFFGDLFDKKGR